MGRMLGSFADHEELDRPDLNKCPDCGCFFPQDNCPLCGKPCPEEMRAGNRKPPKKKKRRGNENGDRVIYLDWYYRWWFILLMLLFLPLIGIILLVVSPHKKKTKIIIAAIAVVYLLISSLGIGNMIGFVKGLWEKPVDTSLDRGEYISACEAVTPEQFYRDAEGYTDAFVRTELTVSYRVYASSGKYSTYYVCRAEEEDFEILVRDCARDETRNFLPGDRITVYGEGDGYVFVYDTSLGEIGAPCINAAYIVLDE